MAYLAQAHRLATIPRSPLRKFGDCGFAEKPWLILGKGPSYARIASVDLGRYNVLAINHVVERIERCEIAHMADWETFESCGEVAESKTRFVCIPYYPFVAFAPSARSIVQLAEDSPALRRLIESGRVLTYNLVCTSGKGRLEGFPDVHLNHFSAEAVIDYLGKSGAARVVSLGIDGGTSYAASFENLVDKTLLASGQPTYDYQFDGIASALFRSDVDYSPLDVRSPVRARIVYEPEHELAAAVLAYSIRRNSPLRVHVSFEHSKTGIRRAAIPHRGVRFLRGAHNLIEIDARSLVVANLIPLLRRVFSGATVVPRDMAWVPGRTIRPRAGAPAWFGRLLKRRVATFERAADLPWTNVSAPLHDVWMAALREAIYWKCVSIRQVRKEIARGNVSLDIFEKMSRNGGGGRG